jgi:hypothetical protein
MTMPAPHEVAEYWSAQWRRLDEKFGKWFSIDIGEPTCFACDNGFGGRYDTGEIKNVPKAWKKAPLHRCHITAKQFGGSDEVANLLLLCVPCHEAAPDISDPDCMIIWALNKENHLAAKWREMEKALEMFGVTPEEAAETFLANGAEISARVGQHFSRTRGAMISASSWAAAIYVIRNSTQDNVVAEAAELECAL